MAGKVKKVKAAPLSDSDGIVFEELLPEAKNQSRKGEWQRRLEAVAAANRIGEWARIRVMDKLKTAITTSQHLRQRAASVPGTWDFAARPEKLTKDGLAAEGTRGIVYAKLVSLDTPRRKVPPAPSQGRGKTFYAWILKKRNDSGYLGKLAEHITNDPKWPRQGPTANQFNTLYKHVSSNTPAGFQREWIDQAWKQYEVEMLGKGKGK